MLQEYLIPFVTILVAELGDKSFFVVAYLSSKTKRHMQIFVGAISAYFLLNGLTVFAGAALKNYLDLVLLKYLAGGFFIFIGIKALLTKADEGTIKPESTNLLRTTFGLILLSEIGDRTNISAGLFATQYHPMIVLVSVTMALALVTLLSIQVGKLLANKINHQLMANIGGLVFILIGTLLIVI